MLLSSICGLIPGHTKKTGRDLKANHRSHSAVAGPGDGVW